MKPTLFWKNFQLGKELDISGNFIYHGIFVFDQMDSFFHEEEIFEMLYNLSVGIERLQKIAIILYDHDETDTSFNFKEFEKNLKSHHHCKLMDRIKKHENLVFEKECNRFLGILDLFYNKFRYFGYSFASIDEQKNEQHELVSFIEKYVSVKISYGMKQNTSITDSMRQFMYRVIDTIVHSIFRLIELKAYELNIYTTELNYKSKAYKIYKAREMSFKNENQYRKEILLNLLDPINFETARNLLRKTAYTKLNEYHTNYYIKNLLNIHKCREGMEELNSIEEEISTSLNDLGFIGNEHIYIDEQE